MSNTKPPHSDLFYRRSRERDTRDAREYAAVVVRQWSGRASSRRNWGNIRKQGMNNNRYGGTQ
jgi:hypothetical protein